MSAAYNNYAVEVPGLLTTPMYSVRFTPPISGPERMRQNQKYPIFTVTRRKPSNSFGLILLLAAVIMGCTGCKERATIEIPKAILHAKDATLDELLEIVNRFDGITSLKANNLEAKYISKKQESGLIELEKYPKAPGFILLRRPDSIRFVLMAPVAKNTLLTLVSVGDEFRVLYHRDRTLYIGKNSAKELISDDLDEKPKIPIRASHILDAIFLKTIPPQDPDIRIAKTEEEDENAKYYVVEVYRDDTSRRLHPLRKFWIERAGLTISRQRIYNDSGQIVSEISYSDTAQYEEFAMPRKINIERPLDGYTLELEFKEWIINSDIKDEAFELQPLPGMKVIRFK
jgi:outer membrane lipoprotein-sorting protein